MGSDNDSSPGFGSRAVSTVLRPMGLAESLAFFAIPAAMLWVATHVCVPRLSAYAGLPVTISWFLCGGFLVFIPQTIVALVLYRREGLPSAPAQFAGRFRLVRPTRKTVITSLLGLVFVGAGTYAVIAGATALVPGFSAHPSFMKVEPLEPGEYWVLLAWLPFFFFNIVGELFYWRGYVFPRQEKAFGRYAWIVHGTGWLVFHVAFGPDLLLTLIPIIFTIPFLVQRTRSSWPDLIIHALINGSGFVLVSLGIVS